jgi:hypothetical protein
MAPQNNMKQKFKDFVQDRYNELIAEDKDPEDAYTQAATEWLKNNYGEKKDEK